MIFWSIDLSLWTSLYLENHPALLQGFRSYHICRDIFNFLANHLVKISMFSSLFGHVEV